MSSVSLCNVDVFSRVQHLTDVMVAFTPYSHTLITRLFEVLMARPGLHRVLILTLRTRLCVCVHHPFCERISLQEQEEKKTWLTCNILFFCFVLLLL